jgi:AmmeMemoRadiSam system protein A
MPGKKPHSEHNHHPLVQLAIDSVESFIKERKHISPPESPTPEMEEKAGVFVCLKKDGQLRGCIGTFLPTTANVAQEIIRNSVSAATEDPRFGCVDCTELDGLDYSVDVLTIPAPVKDIKELNPKKYGVLVQSGPRRGLLLPDLEGVDSIGEQLSIAKRKAGIESWEPVQIFKFEVKRYE